MHRFSEGDFEVRLSEERKDEFGEMNRVFNETTRKIEELMHEVTNSKLLNKEMEFKALQAQINPHFLYNALDTVNWMAMKKEIPRSVIWSVAESSVWEFFHPEFSHQLQNTPESDPCSVSPVYYSGWSVFVPVGDVWM